MISGDIRNIIQTLEQAQRDYRFAFDQVNKCDKETQDILHEMELHGTEKNKRNRLATRLRRVRIERRENKNIVQVNEPLVTFLDSDRGKQMCNLLKEALGKTRKIEEWHQNRIYKKRISSTGEQTR